MRSAIGLSLVRAAAVVGMWLSSAAVGAQAQCPGFAYVASRDDNAVVIFRLDAETAHLRAAGSAPAGASPSAVALDPKHRYLFVANEDSDDVSVYAIDCASGGLAAVPGSPFAAGASPLALAVDPSGGFLYVANHLSNDVSAYAIEPGSGALRPLPGSPIASGKRPTAIVVEPRGRFVYVASRRSNSINAFRVDTASGAMLEIPGSPFAFGDGPVAMAVDPHGAFIYVAHGGAGSLSVRAIDPRTGALAAARRRAVDVPAFPKAIAIDPTGTRVYVATRGGLTVFQRDGDGDLTLSPGAPLLSIDSPLAIDVDPRGEFAFVSRLSEPSASQYLIDLNTAVVLTGRGASGPRFPRGLVVMPAR
jgi:6-phosphogluconolactonase (cycloisomerase 2 family)